MTYQYLNSTCISRVGYNAATGDMIVTFTASGKDFYLSDVPDYHFTGLIYADSPGRYWNEHLKGKY